MKIASARTLLVMFCTVAIASACDRVPMLPDATPVDTSSVRNRSFLETFQYQRFEAIDEQITERLDAALNPDLEADIDLGKLITEAEPIPGQDFSRNTFQQQTIDQTIVNKNKALIDNDAIDLDKLRHQNTLDSTGVHSRQLMQEQLIDQKFEEKNRSLLEEPEN